MKWFTKQRKLTFGEVYETVKHNFKRQRPDEYIYLNSNGYIRILFSWSDKAVVLKDGDVLQFIEYWTDEMGVIHRNDFSYEVSL